MKPGVTNRPVASISRVASPSTAPTAVITPSEIATSPTYGSPPSPSTIVPLRMIKSNAMTRMYDVILKNLSEPDARMSP